MLGSCASHAPELLSPSEGGPSWHRVETSHFRVFSDLDAQVVDQIARDLERDLDALAQAAFENTRPQVAQSDVIVFAHSAAFHEFVSETKAGVFYRRLPFDPESHHTLVTFGNLNAHTRAVLLHELTHDLYAHNFGAAPPWLNEGWAQYYSTTSVEGSTLQVGLALPNMTFTSEGVPFRTMHDGEEIVAFPAAHVVPPSRLLTMTRDDFYRPLVRGKSDLDAYLERTGRYLGAWAFVHLLLDGTTPYSKRFMHFLKEVRESDVQAAWARAFEGVDMAQLDRDFRIYVGRGELTVFTLPYQSRAATTPPRAAQLEDGEVHLLWARLHAARLGEPGNALRRVNTEVEQALRSAPQLAEAHYLRGQIAAFEQQWDIAESELERATELARDEPRYLLSHLVLQFTRRGNSLNEAELLALRPKFERLTRIATSSIQWLTAASYFQNVGESERALALGQKAVALAPIEPQILDGYADLLESAGHWDEALRVQRHAVAFLAENQADEQHYRAHLERLEQRQKQ